MARVSTTHVADDQFHIDIRGHKLTVDQPHPDEAGPSPTELFVASLAACVGHYAVRFLRAHSLPYEGLRVACDWKLLAVEHARVSRVRMEVSTPEPVPAELRDGMQEAMDHCTVHNSLRQPPQVVISLLETPAGAEAGGEQLVAGLPSP
jgi:putative redox protein